MWTPDQANILKEKSKDKIISCAWSYDGLYLAYGTMNGTITIRNRSLELLSEIQRSSAIWCLEWSPITPDYQNSTLLAGIWESAIAQYNIAG